MSNLNDTVGGANFFNGYSYSLTADRFGNPLQAIYINNGYLQVPPGVYFCGSFTTIVWINILSQVAGGPRYLDFSALDTNKQLNYDMVHAIFSNDGSGAFTNCANNPGVGTWNKKNAIYNIAFNNSLKLNTWYHIAVVMQSTNVYIYINGTLALSGTGYVPACISRSSNYIGASNGLNFPNLNAIIDELKIYKGAMSPSQVLTDFTLTSSIKSSNSSGDI